MQKLKNDINICFFKTFKILLLVQFSTPCLAFGEGVDIKRLLAIMNYGVNNI